MIVTYALCGFANFASVGIQIGGLTALEPKKFKVFARLALKAMLAGNITNFITGKIFDQKYLSLIVLLINVTFNLFYFKFKLV